MADGVSVLDKTGLGLTVMVTKTGVPVQPLFVGVTV
jgi:hypothetical protein